MDNEYIEGAGYTSIFMTIFIAIADYIGSVHINDVLQTTTAIFALVFLYFKIKGQILDNRIKRENLEDGKNSKK